MKIKSILYRILLISAFLFSIASCTNEQKSGTQSGNSFTFAFLTDIHVEPERHAEEGFLQAIDSVNKLSPDFVITGGDLIMDALGQSYGRVDSLYNIYTTMVKGFHMP